MMPNATAKIPAAMAHLGRPDSLSVIVELPADRVFADLSLKQLRHQDDFQRSAHGALQRHGE